MGGARKAPQIHNLFMPCHYQFGRATPRSASGLLQQCSVTWDSLQQSCMLHAASGLVLTAGHVELVDGGECGVSSLPLWDVKV